MTERQQRLDWFRRMIEIRLFEDKVQELFQQGLIEGTTHLCQGQEAVSVGAMAALLPDDYLTVTYLPRPDRSVRDRRCGAAVAVGAALSAKLKGEDRIALTFFGDGRELRPGVRALLG